MLYSDYKDFHILEEGLSKLQIELSELQKQQFIDYYELLIEKNKVMNLTAITEFKEVVYKHFIDSLSFVLTYRPNNEKILDLGTGAGFPGIPIKIVFPETEIILMDSLNKRLKFLDDVIEKLCFNRISTLHGRAEDLGRDIKYREKFDICVSRAVARLSLLSEYCIPFIKKGGYFIAFKSGEIEDELEQSNRALILLGAGLDEVKTFRLPGTEIERSLVKIVKQNQTPKIYPRSAGKPAKDPL